MTIRSAMAKGAAWMVLYRLFDRFIGLISTAVLARLLIPADFGLVAMAMSVIAVIELATVFGFDIALIQKQNPERAHYDTAWTLNLCLAAGGSLVTMAAAYPAASYYGDSRLAPIMLVIGLSWILMGFGNVGVVDFRRNMEFSKEFQMMAIKRMISFVVTMVAAWVLRSYWTLVIGMVAGRAIGLVLTYTMHPFRPRLSLRYSRELLSFSSWILVSNLAQVLFSRIPHFVIGRYFGAQSLGAYSVSAELAHLPHTELVAPINRALFPAFSRLVADLDAFRRTCVEATAAIFLFVMPISVAVAMLASQIVRVLLGAQWVEAVPVVQVLSFAGAVSALTANNMSAYQALGRPGLCTGVLLSRMGILVAAMLLIGTRFGVIGVAFAELCAALGSLLVSVPILLSTMKLPAGQYMAALWKPMGASAALGVALHGLLPSVGLEVTVPAAIVQLVAGGAVVLVVYPLSVALLWWLSGKPEGVETMVFRRARAAVLERLRPNPQ